VSEEPRSVGRILWDDLPLLNYLLYALGIAYAEVVNLSPPRRDLFFSCLFPLVVPLVVWALRWRTASARARRVAVACLGGTVALLAASFLFASPRPIEPETLRHVYEASAIANTVLLGVHAWRQSRATFALFFGPAAVYGVLLENGGILLGYFSELDYALYLGHLPAPIATMSGWVTVFYLVTWVTRQIRAQVPAVARSVVASALCAMAAALLLDLQIDPLATAVGFWRWSELLATGPMGVPLLNFVAWACAVFPFALFLFWRQQSAGVDDLGIAAAAHRLWLWLRIPVVLGFAAVLFLLTMTVIEGGFDGPTYGILYTTLVEWGIVAPDVTWTPGA
jgi:uncharacterized membrane protein